MDCSIIPKYKTISGTQDQLRELMKTMKDPEPVTESHITSSGEKVERLVSLESEALNFWAKYCLPPIPEGGQAADTITSYSPVLKPETAPSSKLDDTINV